MSVSIVELGVYGTWIPCKIGGLDQIDICRLVNDENGVYTESHCYGKLNHNSNERYVAVPPWWPLEWLPSELNIDNIPHCKMMWDDIDYNQPDCFAATPWGAPTWCNTWNRGSVNNVDSGTGLVIGISPYYPSHKFIVQNGGELLFRDYAEPIEPPSSLMNWPEQRGITYMWVNAHNHGVEKRHGEIIPFQTMQKRLRS